MKKHNKKQYIVPKIEIIKLDNEISLALESEPPIFENVNIETEIVNTVVHQVFKQLH